MSDTQDFYCPACKKVTAHLMGLMAGMCPCVECHTVLYCPGEDLRKRVARVQPEGRE